MARFSFKLTNMNTGAEVEREFEGKGDGFKWAHEYQENHRPAPSADSSTGAQAPWQVSLKMIED